MRTLVCCLLAAGSGFWVQSSQAQELDNPAGAIGHVVSEQCSKDELAGNQCQFEIVTDVRACQKAGDCVHVSTRRLGLTGTPMDSQFELSCYDDPKVAKVTDGSTNSGSTISISPFSPMEIVNLRANNIWYAVCLNEFLKFPGDDQ